MAGIVGVLTNFGISSIDFPSNSNATGYDQDRDQEYDYGRLLNETGADVHVADVDVTKERVAERLSLIVLPLYAIFFNMGQWAFYVDMLNWYDQ